ncbi:MAG: thioredoxin [Treponema sp.]|nr:thioredoxin [Treponema sp.]MBQ5472944.1 thioredoxin [Treponema sp.]
MVVELNGQNFEAEVLKSDKPVLVDFWATWCGPCKMVSPLVDELAEEHKEYKFCKVNVDDQEDLAARFGIMSIPSLFIFKNGENVKKSVGALPKEEILKLFE